VSQAASLFAVRRIARALAQPTLKFLDGVALVQSCGLLTQELPLAVASPFSILPETAGERQQEGSPHADSAGRIELPQRVGTAPCHSEPAANMRAGETASAPVFSFRRKESTAPPEADTALAPPAVLKIIDGRESRARAKEIPAEIPDPKNTVAGSADALHRATHVLREGAAVARPREMAGTVIELLDSLATELLASPALNPMPASAERDVTSKNTEQRQTSLPAAGHPAASSAPELLHTMQPLFFDSAPQSAHIMPQSYGAPNLTGTSWAQTESAAISPAPPSPNLDAETLASLVNDVLAEQARRHGVDLS